MEHRYGVYNRDTILEQLNKLPENQRRVIMGIYGIDGGKIKTLREISKEINVSMNSIIRYRANALRELGKNSKDLGIVAIPDFEKLCEEDKKKIVKALGNYVFLPSDEYRDEPPTYNIESLDELVEICQEIEKYGMTGRTDEEKEKIEIEAEIAQLQEQRTGNNIPIDTLRLTSRTHNILIRNGLHTVRDVINFDKEFGLENIGNVGKETVEEIRGKIIKYRQEDETTEKIETDDRIETALQIMIRDRIYALMPERTWRCLNRAKINPLDLIDMSEEEINDKLFNVRGLGDKSIERIKSILEEFKRSEEYKTILEMMQRKRQEDQREIIRNSNVGEEYDRIYQEGEEKKEGAIRDSSTPNGEEERIRDEKMTSELENLRRKRDKLREEQRRLQQKLEEATKLLNSYNRFNGDSQQDYEPNPDDK